MQTGSTLNKCVTDEVDRPRMKTSIAERYEMIMRYLLDDQKLYSYVNLCLHSRHTPCTRDGITLAAPVALVPEYPNPQEAV